ncbi:MAG: nucleotidyltransferase family protein [Magnetococcales bacterium]|uniref:Nucleotidyltransferase family protein n=1 Tax=Candidatus Magnetobacterium casense TaxID=1455061 RepID=A0ABS6RZS5_9BACT|nr:nucleotidyltransferase family protein [Candidatus Magnetobacterium casensis]MBF0608061.1 nucleotidyltransferase family protein [Nitrospirota bacterium]MBV6342120.1 nucleotidyltransferase family protein [Candidatus Magnetobacterium casensis]
MKTLSEIKQIIRTHRVEITDKYSVRELGIFGSFATGNEGIKSDVDILVDFSKSVSLLTLVGLENYLSELLGMKADVVPKNDLRREIKDRILTETQYI